MTGLVLLGLAIVWSVLVVQTIPTGKGEGDVGPRAFPLLLGLILVGLSALLIFQSLARPDVSKGAVKSAAEPRNKRRVIEITLAVFITIIGYGFLLEKTGFLLGTIITVITVMVVILKLRRPLLIVGMAFGLAVGCWLIFGKLVGAYLPHGTWISLG